MPGAPSWFVVEEFAAERAEPGEHREARSPGPRRAKLTGTGIWQETIAKDASKLREGMRASQEIN
jgi:hypothetical protein